VHIRDSAGDGLTLAAGASATVVGSEIHTARGRGLSAIDAGALTVEHTIITGSQGPGLWAQCGTGCDCGSVPPVVLREVALTQNASVGLALVGVRSEMNGVYVRSTVPPTDSFEGGAGIAVWGCASVTASALEVTGNASYGMLVDGAAAELSGVEIAGNLQGLWIKSSSPEAGTGASVSDLTLTGNRAVGLGLGGDVVGFIVDGCRILETLAETMPVKKGGEFGAAESLGDAISWQAGAQATLEEVTLGGSARAALVIDGPVGAGSRLSRVTLEGGDEMKPFLQQNLPEGGATPELGESVPALEQFATEQLAVPVAPKTPAGP
jgi:hypothetical protein